MRPRHAHYVGAEVFGHALDVAGHGRRIVHGHALWIDVALRRAIDRVEDDVLAVGCMVRAAGDAREGIGRNAVTVVGHHDGAELAAGVLGMRAITRFDVDDRPDNVDRPAQVRRGGELAFPQPGLALSQRFRQQAIAWHRALGGCCHWFLLRPGPIVSAEYIHTLALPGLPG